MPGWFHITFPLSDPLQIFLLTLLVVLLAPLIFRIFRIPGIVGLILSGIIVGPHGLNLLSPDVNFNVLSTVGIIYLMFLLGLELDRRDFGKKALGGIIFGLATFFIPFIAGFITFRYVLGYQLLTSLLIAVSFSTHTLLSYPITSRLGINKNRVVSMAVGGTIITDTAVLMTITYIAMLAGNGTSAGVITVTLSLLILTFLIIWGLPRLSRWFFRINKGDDHSLFIYVLTVVFFSAFLGQLMGIEPIIGAFLAGLALNRIIPPASNLTNRIVFFGNALFIPFFLISIGMIIDLNVLFRGWKTLGISLLLIILGLLTKFLAALVPWGIFKLNKNERNLLFGLSSSRAAAILVVMLIGYRIHLINEEMLNATLLFILVSSLVGSFITEISGKKLAIAEAAKAEAEPVLPERILIPVSNPRNILFLLDFAFAIKDPSSKDPLYPLTVVPDTDKTNEIIRHNFRTITQGTATLGHDREQVLPMSRVDINITHAIALAAKEMMASALVLGWKDQSPGEAYVFGSLIDNLLNRTDRMVLICSIKKKVENDGKILVIIPPFSEFETGFGEWVKTTAHLAHNTGRPIRYAGSPNAIARIGKHFRQTGSSYNMNTVVLDQYPETGWIQSSLHENDLLIMIAARHRTLSYHTSFENLPHKISHEIHDRNFAIIYPAQQQVDADTLSSQLEGLKLSPIQENIERFRKIFNYFITFSHHLKKRQHHSNQ